MTCFSPVRAWRSPYVNPETEKRTLTFNRKSGFEDMELALPCGKCLGCLKKRVDEWALRCVHESFSHEQNCFITLTYDDDHLPSDGSLNHKHFQDFMKRLRKKFSGKKIRYFMCGEYGGLNLRPHFHALLFGLDFIDKVEFSQGASYVDYTSNTLAQLWPYGYHTIGDLNFGTARYVAKYSIKTLKELGLDYDALGLKPEYIQMSNGIGRDYALKYNKEISINDDIILNGFKNPVPRYYENFISKSVLSRMKDERVKHMKPVSISELRIKEAIYINECKLWQS